MVLQEEREKMIEKAREKAEDEVLDALLPPVDFDGVMFNGRAVSTDVITGSARPTSKHSTAQ